MLDYRAWIAAGLVLLAAAGGFLLYVHRTRAGYHARSLSASGQPANPDTGALSLHRTRMLHVEGCDKDFVAKVGELVEPRAVPGAPLEAFQSIYDEEARGEAGDKETKREDERRRKDEQTFIWRTYPFTLSDRYLGPESPGNAVTIGVNAGHVVQTLDDVELGIDSMGALFRKLRDRKIELHQRIERGDGTWTLTVSFFSLCGRRYRSEYAVTLRDSDEVEYAIVPPAAPQKGDQQNGGPPWRSAIFMNKVIYDYALVPSGGRDESAEGHDAELR